MKGLGNYRPSVSASPLIERQAGTLVAFHGPRATVTMMGGLTYALPSAPFVASKIAPGQRFILITKKVGGRAVEVRIEPPAEARPAMERRQTPKVYVKDGTRLTTRR